MALEVAAHRVAQGISRYRLAIIKQRPLHGRKALRFCAADDVDLFELLGMDVFFNRFDDAARIDLTRHAAKRMVTIGHCSQLLKPKRPTRASPDRAPTSARSPQESPPRCAKRPVPIP